METDGAKQGIRLWDLRSTTCRWPLGGPWEHVEFFCGEPTFPSCSYCREHRKRAVVQATGSSRRPFMVKYRRPAK